MPIYMHLLYFFFRRQTTPINLTSAAQSLGVLGALRTNDTHVEQCLRDIHALAVQDMALVESYVLMFIRMCARHGSQSFSVYADR